MARKSKYADCTQSTQQFMAAVERFLKKKYGKIEDHWLGQLDLLAANYELFQQAKDEVKKEGMLITNRFGAMEKNPLLKVIVDANIQIQKLVNQFGLSPSANGKIKQVEDEEDTAKIISNLING